MKLKKIILISGKSNAGKDTSAGIIKQQLERKGKTALITHFGDPVKHWAVDAFGWNGLKDKAGRSMLQHIGTDIMRKTFPDYWAEYIAKFIFATQDEWDYVIIPDLRFKNEYEAFLNYFPADMIIKVLIRRVDENGKEKKNNSMTKEQLEHQSENSFNQINFDYDYAHPDLLMLTKQVKEIVDAVV